MRKIQRAFGDRCTLKTDKIVINRLNNLKVTGRDILAVSINDFDGNPRFSLPPAPLKCYSEKGAISKNSKNLHVNPIQTRKSQGSFSKSIIIY